MGMVSRILRKLNPANRAIVATVTPGQPIWTKKDYAKLAEAGYQNVAVVFACVKTIASTAARINWVLRDRRDNELYDHSLLTLLRRPNDRDSGIVFTEKVLSYELLAGNSYLYMASSGMTKLDGGAYPPRFLYSLRPDRMRAIPGDWRNPIAYWEYRAASQLVPFRVEEVIHLLEFHPTNDWYGLSRLEVAARDIDISNEAKAWNKSLLQNFMTPAGMMNFKSGLSPEQREEFRKETEQVHAGPDNAGRFIITEGEALWTQMSMLPKDLDWKEGQKFTMRQLCSVFGCPSMLLGDTEATTYNNYKEARRALYEETVLPLMDVYTGELNARLVPLFGEGLVLDYDRDAIEALQEERSTKYAYLAMADWVSINEKRRECGFDDIAEGDVLLVPMTNIPLDQAAAEPEPVPDALKPGIEDEEEPEEEEPEEEEEAEPVKRAKARKRKAGGVRAIKAIRKSYWTEDGRRAKLWDAFDVRTKARARTFRSLALRYMAAQADALRERVKHYPTVGAVVASDLVDVEAEAKRYAETFQPWYVDHALRAGQAGLSATRGEVLDESKVEAPLTGKAKPPKWTFDLTPNREEQLMRMVFDSGTKVNQSLVDIVYNTVRAAQEGGSTIDWLSQQIWEQVDEFSPARSRLWAETESTKVDNWATLEGYKESAFVELKGWNCQMLDTSREEHIVADGEEVPLDEPFVKTGEELMFPGDPAGSASNVCNCRCSQYPVVSKDDLDAEGAAGEAAQWKPQMTRAEADSWAKDSAVKETLNHNTGAAQAEGITKEGFQVGTGSLYGKGVYMSNKPVTAYGPVNLKLRVNVQKVYDYTDSLFGEATDWWVDKMYDKYGPVGRGRCVAEYLKSMGYDALRIPNRYDNQTWYCVLDPKSVTVLEGGGK